MMGLGRQHLLLLFIAGLISRGFVKSLLGANASFLLLVGVVLYYLYMKRQSESIYDEIARQQAKAAVKLDAIHSLGDSKLSDAETLASRQTHFHLNETDRMVITDRMHKYSNKMGGSRKDRKKFLVSRSKFTEEEALALATSATTNLSNTNKTTPSAVPKTNTSSSKGIEKLVEETL